MGGHRQEVKLLGILFSPYVRRVVWTLKLKGIEYEMLEENFRDPNSRSQSLTKYNPVLKRVPVLVHNGKPVVESLVILEYLDETWNYNPILPSDRYERAMARFWANFIEQKEYISLPSAHFYNSSLISTTVRAKSCATDRNVKYRVIEVLSKLLCLVDDKVTKEEVKQANDALEIVDEELKVKGKKFFGGEKIGFVDIVLNRITNWMEAIEEVLGITIFDPQNHSFINQGKNNFLELPIIKENLPPKHRLLRFYTTYRQSKLAAPSRM